MITDQDSTISDDFQRLIDPYRAELLVHCYRFLGSLFDAEDALQETLLRAWRGLASLRQQASLRAWLYRIATNICLDMVDKRRPRLLPTTRYPPADPQNPLPLPVLDPVWLEPLPDETLTSQSPGPEARYDARESVSLAFLAVLQLLPARQRAALILRDVLGWKPDEVADLLKISVAASNSALQRARSTMIRHQSEWAVFRSSRPTDLQTEALLTRYRQAWENADLDGLVSLLRDDAVLSMPPLPAWFGGRTAIAAFYQGLLSGVGSPGRFKLLAARANGCPAFATYQRGDDLGYHPVSISLLALEESHIVRIDTFLVNDDWLFRKFGLPVSL